MSEREPQVIDFTRGRGWGHDFTFRPAAGGMSGSGHFWFSGVARVGDFLILPNGKRSTRYRITSLTYHRDPQDMRSFEAEFAPRDIPT